MEEAEEGMGSILETGRLRGLMALTFSALHHQYHAHSHHVLLAVRYYVHKEQLASLGFEYIKELHN